MHAVHLENVDLNLLPALTALLDEQQISRAAARTGLSQPAMSRALQRLRRTLGDDLLVRDRGRYRLTPRAERIREQLVTIGPVLGEIFRGETFDPGAWSQRIQLCASDYGVATLGIPLSRALLEASPQSSLRFQPWHEGMFDDVIRGDVDLVFFGAEAPAPLHSTALFDERFVCVVADTHPLAGHTAIGLSDYLGYRHLVIDITGGRQPAVDQVLGGRGTPRTVGSVMPFHAVAPLALAGTELILTFPERLIPTSGSRPGLRVLTAPPEIGTMTYHMAWHPRLDSDAAHRWLRETTLGVATQLRWP